MSGKQCAQSCFNHIATDLGKYLNGFFFWGGGESDLLARFAAYSGDCPRQREPKEHKKCKVCPPYFTMSAQKTSAAGHLARRAPLVLEVILQIQSLAFCEHRVERNTVAFLRCSTFPCRSPKQAHWLTTQTTQA